MNDLPRHLVYLTDDGPGISRKRYGNGFAYYHFEKGHIKENEELNRIKNLVIPPAWRNVWIAPISNGHLQATGRDQRKRKQYRYHDDWTVFAASKKYRHLKEFGQVLPTIRKRYAKDLTRKKWDFEKTAALAIAVMDTLHLRVGSNYYSQVNHTYGLTTLRRKHLHMDEGALELSFTGKTGKERSLRLADKKLVRLVKECSDLPGYEIFRYRTPQGLRQLKSEDFNEYLRAISGLHSASAKDFRTWGANVLCYMKVEEATALFKDSKQKLENILVKLVAKEMGHTVNTCKSSYLHPKVIQDALAIALGEAPKNEMPEEAAEELLRDLLDRAVD